MPAQTLSDQFDGRVVLKISELPHVRNLGTDTRRVSANMIRTLPVGWEMDAQEEPDRMGGLRDYQRVLVRSYLI